MSQIFTDDCYSGSHQAGVDLQSFENNFAALKSMFSGLTTPSNPVAGMHWFDTTKKTLKMRNYANGAWLGIFQADAAHKIWVYRNTAPDGWLIDSTVVDVVLALKGGSQAYNANGGTQAGTWTQPGHALTVAELAVHAHETVGNHVHPGAGGTIGVIEPAEPGSWACANGSTGGGGYHSNIGSGDSHNHGTTYRPLAAIGTLQYLDL